MKKITKIETEATRISKQPKLRVAAYCRVSTDSEEQLESLETQKFHYEHYIASQPGWELAGIYYDRGVTGTKKEKRFGLLQMIADCEKQKINFIVTKSISRFSRNTTDCLELVRRLLALHVPIYFEKEDLNTGSMENELMLSILSGLAESESVSIAENCKWSVKRRFQNGSFKLPYAPYGYDLVDGQLMINEEQAQMVRFLFAEILSGKGTSKIAEELNRRNVPTKRGGRWTATTIRGMVNNEKYTGDAILQKTYTDAHLSRHINHGETEQYLIENHHEGIISHEDFNAAQEVIQQHGREKGVGKRSRRRKRYPFSGIIICSECGSTFKRQVHSSGKVYAAWCCSKHISDRSNCSMRASGNLHLNMPLLP